MTVNCSLCKLPLDLGKATEPVADLDLMFWLPEGGPSFYLNYIITCSCEIEAGFII